VTSKKFDDPMISCPLCSSEALGHFDRDFRGVNIDICHSCKLLFMNPQYTEDYLNDYYSNYVTEEERSGKISEDRYRQKRAAFDFLTPFKSEGRFLAVGCGGGLELEIARELGFMPEGYDVDPDATREVSERIGLPVHSGDFFELDLSDSSFDCLFLDQVLEHPKDPAKYLRKIHQLLKPEGVVYLGVPNLSSFSARLKGLLGRLGLKKRSRGKHFDTDHHLFYYRPEPLAEILEKEFGFEILAMAGDPRVSISSARYGLARRIHPLCSRFAIVARPRR
jgi:2-polyprenyl-3-methyl-5-hydroxy-6-metoxy-1,4-benzoquinol methylase